MMPIKTISLYCYTVMMLAVCFWLFGASFAVQAQECTHGNAPAFYVHEKYKVREVRIESWLNFLLPIPHELATLQLPLRPGDDFSLNKSNAGREQIREWLKTHEQDTDLRFEVRVVKAEIRNCQENQSPRQLDVVYWIFTTNPGAYFSHPSELKNEEVERPAVTAAITQPGKLFKIKPFVNYNRTRQLFSGTQVQMHTPTGIFNTFDLNVGASTTSREVEINLSGSQAPEGKLLNHLEYQLGYKHSDLPADDNRLREGTLRLQFLGATRPLGARGVIARFGASIEGGNQQTNLLATESEHSLQNSSNGALKTYMGVTLRTSRLSLSGSYGLQIGTLGATTNIDFLKHISDIVVTASWPPRKNASPGKAHKVTTLEAQVTGGIIQVLGRVPVAERFFGGNTTSDFIAGNSWRIRNGPLIRSIPQNRLNSSPTIGAIGGTSFYSINLTIARPVWGYAIIPKDIANDPDFLPAVSAEKSSTRSILKGYYLSKLNVLDPIANHMMILDSDLAEVVTILESFPNELPGALPDEIIENYEEDKPITHDRAINIRRKLLDKDHLPSQLLSILKDSDQNECNADPESCSILTNIRFRLGRIAETLTAVNLNETSTKIKQVTESLARKQGELLIEFETVDTSKADRLADADMRLISPVLDTFIKELNWIAISPVGIFDVARIWPDHVGTRLGIGGGLRATVVNFNVTMGYAFNPTARKYEGHGSFFFSMDVTNLFR